MQFVLCLRLLNNNHARPGIEGAEKEGSIWYRNGIQRGTLLDTGVERRSIALKNVASRLIDSGRLAPVKNGILKIDNRQLPRRSMPLWVLIDSQYPIEFWSGMAEVDLIFPADDLTILESHIRGRSGINYITPCDRFADSLAVNQQERDINYREPIDKIII